MKIINYLFLSIIILCEVSFGADLPRLKIVDGKTGKSVAITLDAEIVACAPREGLWSVAVGFDGKWPSEWKFADSDSVEINGGAAVLSGITLRGT